MSHVFLDVSREVFFLFHGFFGDFRFVCLFILHVFFGGVKEKLT